MHLSNSFATFIILAPLSFSASRAQLITIFTYSTVALESQFIRESSGVIPLPHPSSFFTEEIFPIMSAIIEDEVGETIPAMTAHVSSYWRANTRFTKSGPSSGLAA
jgi:hypothetical protein